VVNRHSQLSKLGHLADEELMKLYQNGEYQAFDVIYKRHHNRVYTYLKKRLYDQDMVHELFQNIMLKFHKSRVNYRPEFALEKWIYTLCRSVFLDYLKKRKVHYQELQEEDYCLSDEKVENHNIDLESVKSLTQNEKKVISLRYYSDQDFEEISKALNLSESNVRKLISRGIKKLKKKFGEKKNGV
jgi:RNA polymerase sigma-70 factor, ECF subfamily